MCGDSIKCLGTLTLGPEIDVLPEIDVAAEIDAEGYRTTCSTCKGRYCPMSKLPLPSEVQFGMTKFYPRKCGPGFLCN